MNIRNGLPAGAAGTAALNAFTYIDMALRGRPPSELPQKIVSSLAEKIGIEHIDDSRRSALGALLGYADGFGAGALLGIVRPHIRGVPWLWTGLLLGAATMLLSEGSATLLKQTDPRQWSAADWIFDVIPRSLYGCVACITFDLLDSARSSTSPEDFCTDQFHRLGYMEEVEFDSQRVAPGGT
ncbi:MAG TPA: hypothetical protein VGZ02_13775 [Candidatus Baltobacteraceae bacterium]|jgi:hypothetical protein|nr:hypothetical protein [Candidatus Baltobacteraceae bacterium]